MPPRKRKVNYPVAGSGKKRAAPAPADEPAYTRTSVVAIDLTAGAGRGGLTIGDRVRIIGSGLYSGEEANIEKFVGTAIPAGTPDGSGKYHATITYQGLTDGVTHTYRFFSIGIDSLSVM